MTKKQPTHSFDNVDDYATHLWVDTLALLRRHRHLAEVVEDIAQTVVVDFLARSGSIMLGYPHPYLYAATRAYHAAVDFERRDRVQRGEGVKLVPDTAGLADSDAHDRRSDQLLMRPTRPVVAGDAQLTNKKDEVVGTLWETVANGDLLVEDLAIDRLVAEDMIGQIAEILPRELFATLVLSDGRNQTEVAEILGIARETVCHRLSRARAILRVRGVSPVMS